MPPVPKTKQNSKKPFSLTYEPKTKTGLVLVSQRVRPRQRVPFAEVIAEVEHIAYVTGVKNGPQLNNRVHDALEGCDLNGLIDADFEREDFEITPLGYQIFQEMSDEATENHVEEEAQILAIFVAIRKHLGPMNALTKRELRSIVAELKRKESERKKRELEDLKQRDATASRLDFSNTAGPSNSDRIFGTPLRKTMSMGAYPTPESLPRLAAPLFRPLPQAPPPSPSPRGSFAMDIDEPTESGHRDLNNAASELSRPQPSTPEDEAQLRKTQDELAILSARYQDCEEARKAATAALEELQDDVSFLRSMQELTEEEDNAFRLDMDDFITELKNQKGALEQEKVDLRNKVDALEAEKTRSEEWRVKLVEDAAKLTAALSAGFPAD